MPRGTGHELIVVDSILFSNYFLQDLKNLADAFG
jgi:hypothetical protein